MTSHADPQHEIVPAEMQVVADFREDDERVDWAVWDRTWRRLLRPPTKSPAPESGGEDRLAEK